MPASLSRERLKARGTGPNPLPSFTLVRTDPSGRSGELAQVCFGSKAEVRPVRAHVRLVLEADIQAVTSSLIRQSLA